MAGTVKANSVQLGDSATDSQNFQLRTNVDGTAKLARGGAGTLGDIFTISAAGVITAAGLVANPGEVVQIATKLDVGTGSQTSTTLINLTSSLFSFTPKNASSSLLIECSFNAVAAYISGSNISTIFQMFENTVAGALGSSYVLNVQIGAGGAYPVSPVTVRAVVANAALTTRTFGLGGSTSASGVTSGFSGSAQVWSITEIKI